MWELQLYSNELPHDILCHFYDVTNSVLQFEGNTPFAGYDNMAQNPPYWNANCALGHSKQRRFKLEWFKSLSRSLRSSMTDLYHVIISCKGPIVNNSAKVAKHDIDQPKGTGVVTNGGD